MNTEVRFTVAGDIKPQQKGSLRLKSDQAVN